MKYTVIHPSRSRAKLAHTTRAKWLKDIDSPQVQWIMSLDDDDPQLDIYKASSGGCDLVIGKNRNLIDAVQHAIPLIKNECVIVVSDDFDPTPEWNIILAKLIAGKTDYGVYVNDGYSFGRKVMTLPILSHSLVEKLGYIYYPAYTGMFADNDLYELLDHNKLLLHLDKKHVFQHNHYTNGRADIDATYRRHNTNESWVLGEALLNDRRESMFDGPPGSGELLSVLIPSIIERGPQLLQLMSRFKEIAGGELVDYVIEVDNRQMTIGEKRNRLLAKAKGRWIVFFDDDDWPFDGYIKNIYKAIRTKKDIDCIGIWGMMTTNGVNKQKWCHRLGFPIAAGHQARTRGYDYVRPIWHFNPVKREIALAVGFNEMKSFGEDAEYAAGINPLLTKEYFIPDAAFHYRFTRESGSPIHLKYQQRTESQHG